MTDRMHRAKQGIRSQIHRTLAKYPLLRGRMLFLLPHILEHPVDSRPRYGSGRPPHPQLTALLNQHRSAYRAQLDALAAIKPHLQKISVEPQGAAPCWRNFFFTGLDAAALYGFLARGRPQRYMEVGSGHSTRFARRAIQDHGLATSMTCIDPAPRVEVDDISDRVLRQPLETINLVEFDALEDGDILLIDNSHRVFMNSDACVVFMDILPRLKPGVLVHLHDIFLPHDYPAAWADRYYSEQYLLGSALLAGAQRYEVVLPNHFVRADAELGALAAGLFSAPTLQFIPNWLESTSFWLRIKG